jgi:hypothetical protein
LGISRQRSRWGSRAAGAYLLALSAATGFVTYQACFNRSRFEFPGSLLLSLGLPWTRTWTGASWPALFLSFAVNAGLLYLIGSRFERMGRGEL